MSSLLPHCESRYHGCFSYLICLVPVHGQYSINICKMKTYISEDDIWTVTSTASSRADNESLVSSINLCFSLSPLGLQLEDIEGLLYVVNKKWHLVLRKKTAVRKSWPFAFSHFMTIYELSALLILNKWQLPVDETDREEELYLRALAANRVGNTFSWVVMIYHHRGERTWIYLTGNCSKT